MARTTSLAFFIGATIMLNLFACRKPEIVPGLLKTYSGPLMTLDSTRTIYSDSGRVIMTLKSANQSEYSNGDREFPKGVFIDFFNRDNQPYAYLKADYAQYDVRTDTYKGFGNVVIVNKTENKRMETEELRWNPMNKKVFTDKFVKITTPDEQITGTGLEAAQDFSYYKLYHIEGIITLDNSF